MSLGGIGLRRKIGDTKLWKALDAAVARVMPAVQWTAQGFETSWVDGRYDRQMRAAIIGLMGVVLGELIRPLERMAGTLT